MKKSIIAAGAASVALAAMPIVGVFADLPTGPYTDTLNVSIDTTCSFTRDVTTAHPDVVYPAAGSTATVWTTGSGAAANTDTLNTVNMSSSLGSEAKIASSKFHVVCNDVDGYQVTVAAANLVKPATGTGTTAEAAASINYVNAGSTADGEWRLTSTGVGQNIGAATDPGDRVIYETATTTGRDFVIDYYVHPGASQAAGTYSGNVVYSFAQLPVSGS